MRRLATTLLTILALTAAPVSAQERGLISNMGACSSRAPRLWLVVDGASATDCASGGGTSQVLCLCTGGAWATVGGASLPQHVQDYSPLRKSASCAICEEFTDGALSQSWSWGNQGTSTETLELDRARINDSGTTRGSHRLVAAPAAGTDFTVTARLELALNSSSSDYAGLSVIHGGTLASPTAVLVFGLNFNGTNWNFLIQELTNYTTWSATTYTGGTLYNFASPIYLQGRYAQSTKVFTMFYSFDGLTWLGSVSATKTLSNHPTYLGRFNDTDRTVYTDFFRVRTDANRDLAGE